MLIDFSAWFKGMADGNTAVWGKTTEPSEGNSGQRKEYSEWNGRRITED